MYCSPSWRTRNMTCSLEVASACSLSCISLPFLTRGYHSPKFVLTSPGFFDSLLSMCESPNNTSLNCGAQTWLGQERSILHICEGCQGKGLSRIWSFWVVAGPAHQLLTFPQHLWPRRRTGKREAEGPDKLPAQVGLWKREYLVDYSVFTKA